MNFSPRLSIIICTHNPRKDYMERTLNSIKLQDYPSSNFELLLIDNASKQNLKETLDLTWHPNAKVIREDELGLTPARLRGIKEAQGDILLFIDDDNVLNKDFLSVGMKISLDKPSLGAWGGRLKGEFEAEVPAEYHKYLWMLAVIEQDRDHWSNTYGSDNCMPTGAGMFLRREVAIDYLQKVQNDPIRLSLDRKGNSLSSCGDIDMARCALDLNYGIGTFVDLKFTHLIPEARLKEEYLVKLASANAYSKPIVDALRKETKGIIPRLKKPSSLDKGKRIIKNLLSYESFDSKIFAAQQAGLKKALKVIQEMENS